MANDHPNIIPDSTSGLAKMQASQDSGVAFLEETSFLPASLEAIPFPSVDLKIDLDGVATGMGVLQVRACTELIRALRRL